MIASGERSFVNPRHMYHVPIDRYGFHAFAIFVIVAALGFFRSP